jgi:hypothetical protein
MILESLPVVGLQIAEKVFLPVIPSEARNPSFFCAPNPEGFLALLGMTTQRILLRPI